MFTSSSGGPGYWLALLSLQSLPERVQAVEAGDKWQVGNLQVHSSRG